MKRKKNKKRLKIFILFVIASVLFYLAYSLYVQKLNDSYESNIDAIDYRQEMRQWVITISETAKAVDNNFIIIPQNCAPLFTDSGQADGAVQHDFIDAIDGVGQEGLSFGDGSYNSTTDKTRHELLGSLLRLGVYSNLSVLVTDYCDSQANIKTSKNYCTEHGFISFQAQSISLTDTQADSISHRNTDNIHTLDDAQNFLFLLNPETYADKADYLAALSATNYDVLIIDAFFDGDEMLTQEDVMQLKTKAVGGKRLIVSYLSIGEAEDYRYYWDSDWKNNPPAFLLDENPFWKGNYPVKYWDSTWQDIVALGENSYLNKIIKRGFDGVYLDIVDGYEAFEDEESLLITNKDILTQFFNSSFYRKKESYYSK